MNCVLNECSRQKQNNPMLFFRFSVSGRIFWTICEIPTKFGQVFAFFLFSTPLFLGDRATLKFQHESAQKLQNIGDFAWTIAKKKTPEVVTKIC